MEYDSANPIMNLLLPMIILLVIVLLLVLSFIILGITWCTKYDKIKKWADDNKKSIIWGGFIRFFLEEYIAFSIAGLLKMHSLDFSNWFESISSLFGIFMLILVIVAPILTKYVLYKKHE